MHPQLQGDVGADKIAWNFANLCGRGTGKTIEWRQPPGVTTADECLAWTELAVAFVRAARDWKDIGLEMKTEYTSDVEGLKQFVKGRGRGAEDLGETGLHYLDLIFQDKSGRVSPVPTHMRIDYREYEE